jgi:class 3 adenylate cyclase
VVFTDLVGFSEWALGAGDDAMLRLLRWVAQVVDPSLIEAGGQVVKRMGDGIMAVFPDPVSAIVGAGKEVVSAHRPPSTLARWNPIPKKHPTSRRSAKCGGWSSIPNPLSEGNFTTGSPSSMNPLPARAEYGP